MDQSSLHIEANVSESAIGGVKAGQEVDVVLDAFGPDKHFFGKVVSVDPASTLIAGVINYRVIVSVSQDPGIKQGMTANLTITVAEKPNALAVPNGLIVSKDGKKFVMVLQNNQAVEVPVETGIVGDSVTELLSGVNAGDTVVAPTDNQ